MARKPVFIQLLAAAAVLDPLTSAAPNGFPVLPRQLNASSTSLSAASPGPTFPAASVATATATAVSSSADAGRAGILQELLTLFGWSLDWFADAIGAALRENPPSIGVNPLLTAIPGLASLVPATAAGAATRTTWFLGPTAAAATTTGRSTTVSNLGSSRTVSSVGLSTSSPPATPNLDLDLNAGDVVEVYAGRYDGVSNSLTALQALCAAPDISIITLSSVTSFTSSRGLPAYDFGALCPVNATANATTPDCSALTAILHDCQQVQGKSLFLAVDAGGSPATTLTSAAQAQALAHNLWDMFGAGRATSSGARLFGGSPRNELGVVFDGFEFFVSPSLIVPANETTLMRRETVNGRRVKRQGERLVPVTLPYFDDLFRALRELYEGRAYFLGVNLPCARPAVLSKSALLQADMVTVRFMNDSSCEVDGAGFLTSLKAWAEDLGGGPESSATSLPSPPTLTSTIPITRYLTTTIHVPRPSSSSSSSAYGQPREPGKANHPGPWSAPFSNNSAQAGQHRHFHPSHGPTRLRVKRQSANPAPHLLVGLPLPSEQTINGTAINGVASLADDAFLSEIIASAKRSSGFSGVMLWGPVSGMGLNTTEGFVPFLKRELRAGLPISTSSTGSSIVPTSTTISVVSTTMSASPTNSDIAADQPATRSVTLSLTPNPAATNFASFMPIESSVEETLTVTSTRLHVVTMWRNSSMASTSTSSPLAY